MKNDSKTNYLLSIFRYTLAFQHGIYKVLNYFLMGNVEKKLCHHGFLLICFHIFVKHFENH